MNFTENNVISTDKRITKNMFTLYQNIGYDAEAIIDEEYNYTLKLFFPDPTTAKTRKILNLSTDTAIVKSIYEVVSPWGSGGKNNGISGQIEIIEWSKNSVTLKENITVYVSRRKQIVTFVGTRTFTKKKGW